MDQAGDSNTLETTFESPHIPARQGPTISECRTEPAPRAGWMVAKATPPSPLAPTTGPRHYVCFFDSGSRGNPGPGGAGSVIVRVNMETHAAELEWCSCMAYGSKNTTNNIAEYWGLIHGLRYATSHKLRPLHVVGDRALILNQVENHRLPKAAHLQPLYLVARRLATPLDVSTWTHHLHAYNKMADAAANVAMEDRASLQCTAEDNRPEMAHIRDLPGDMAHWFDARRRHDSRLRSPGLESPLASRQPHDHTFV